MFHLFVLFHYFRRSTGICMLIPCSVELCLVLLQEIVDYLISHYIQSRRYFTSAVMLDGMSTAFPLL